MTGEETAHTPRASLFSVTFAPYSGYVEDKKEQRSLPRARIGGLGRRKSLLVYDSFEAHVTDTVKASFKRENTELAVIPGGLTSLLQPLDVSLNKPFKDGVRKRWMQWMADGTHEFTATGRQKKASEELICSWISQAWNAIPSEMIAASF